MFTDDLAKLRQRRARFEAICFVAGVAIFAMIAAIAAMVMRAAT